VGPVTLGFTSNSLYRAGLIGGLALLPLLALLAFLPVRRPRPTAEAARPWQPGRVATSVAVVAAAAVISGIPGAIVGGAALGVRYLLRNRERLCEAVTVGLAAGGLTLAGALLSQNPWRSVDGYAGHSAGVQLLALVSVAMLAASTVSVATAKKRSAGPARAIASAECPT
jgi:arabinofuranan 3-O-arabinosyltransferase